MPASSRKRGRKGGPKGWTTPEQCDWLKEQVARYIALRGDGQRFRNKFWEKLFEGWFERWPEESDVKKVETVCIIVQLGPVLMPAIAPQTMD